MLWFRRTVAKLRCQLGRHVGGNFCAHCGCQLLSAPFYPFRVTNPTTGSVETIQGLNISHVRQLIGDVAREMEIQRLPLP